MKSAEIRLAEILLIAGQTLFDAHGEAAEPYLTLVGYFNATRELAGMRRYLDDDVTTRVRSHGRRKGLSNRIVSATGLLTIQELTSRVSSADISDVLKRLETAFDPDLDTSARRRAVLDDMRSAKEKGGTGKGSKEKGSRERSGREKDRRPRHPVSERFDARRDAGREPVDVVLATSMLQVGVDVSRFGLMAVVGQPKNTAEYIQASSRVGRDAGRPGLVVTLYNWARPRDLAHYEDFEHYHATFYRQVEALSVTPYTRRSLDRGTTATFVTAVRHADERHSRNADAHDVELASPAVTRVVARLLARAEVVGGPRGRSYLEERIKVVAEEWDRARNGSVRLGYSTGTFARQRLLGLLEKAGNGHWGNLTVSQSMRETENEINLLVPAGAEIFAPTYDGVEWSFTAPADGPVEDDDAPPGDELGETTLTSVRRAVGSVRPAGGNS
jgi:hypothetical protein